jgi:hypothetical protein
MFDARLELTLARLDSARAAPPGSAGALGVLGHTPWVGFNKGAPLSKSRAIGDPPSWSAPPTNSTAPGAVPSGLRSTEFSSGTPAEKPATPKINTHPATPALTALTGRISFGLPDIIRR